MPRETLFVELLHERIGVELLDIEDARLAPESLAEHHRTNHCRNTSGIAYTLHTRFHIGILVLAVIIYIIGVLLAVFESADTAADRGFALVVLAQVLRIRQYGLEELQGNNLHLDGFSRLVVWSFGRLGISVAFLCQRCLIDNLIDAAHADVLNHFEVLEILLSEGHPEAGALDGWIVDDE